MKEVPPKIRKKMEQLLDDNFIKDFFDKNLITFFKTAKQIKKIERKVYKIIRGKETYTFVFEFKLELILKNNRIAKKSVFCTAHSKPYKNKALLYMQILYENGFQKSPYKIPRPLLYAAELKAGFYEGAEGQTLLYYLKRNQHKKITRTVKDAARWISKLHHLDIKKFNSAKITLRKIKDNHPSGRIVLKEMKKNYPKLYKEFHPLYKRTLYWEKKMFHKKNVSVIYGDYHPENIIVPKNGHAGIVVIDFNDLSLGDPYRDLGAFSEQVEFMSGKYMAAKKAREWSKIFLDEYAKINKLTFDKEDLQRINLYSLWTCLRNIIYFYYKCDPERVIWALIKDAKLYLEKIENKNLLASR